ncbi:MAG: hypothetical protein GTN49_09930 [candidate division Zixibacteria bacterium]|nr:hypothetical protein [candidate division Zixibacteria bacterium]
MRGSRGTGNGQFDWPNGVAVAPNRNVYVADTLNNRVQYFTPTGTYLGRWGSKGTGDGELDHPSGLCLDVTGARVYVADMYNHRVQYFRWSGPLVAPTSLGRVKELFR